MVIHDDWMEYRDLGPPPFFGEHSSFLFPSYSHGCIPMDSMVDDEKHPFPPMDGE